MNDLFEKKVRAAAVAGWWVVLIAMRCFSLYGSLTSSSCPLGLPGCSPCGGKEMSVGLSCKRVTLVYGHIQVLHLAHDLGSPLVDAVGEAVAQLDRQGAK